MGEETDNSGSLPREASTSDSLLLKSKWDSVREQLRSRAKSARRMSIRFFVLSVLVFGVGILGIVFANHILDPRFGTSTASSFDYPVFPEQTDGVPSIRQEPANAKTNPEIEAIKEEVKKLTPRVAATESAVSQANERLGSLEGSFDEVKLKMTTLEKEMTDLGKEVAHGTPRLEFLVTAFATRFGIAAVALLMVKILTSSYRYHIRLAAHFDSKADALELAPIGDVAAFEKLCLAVSPSGVDFQESADSIADHAVEIAKKIVPGRT